MSNDIVVQNSDYDLLEYLRHVKQLESSIYYLNRAIDLTDQKYKAFNNEYKQCQQKIYQAEGAIPKKTDAIYSVDAPAKIKINGDLIAGPLVMLIVIAVIALVLYFSTPGLSGFAILCAIIPLLMIIVRIINVVIDNVHAQDDFEKAKKRAHNAYLKDKRKSKENLSNVQDEVEEKLELFEEKASATLEVKGRLTDTLAKTTDALKRLYSLNIIYPKYRNLVAVCSIFEYLDSGRCSELSGPNGAYNLYESELRLNIIIDKMDVIAAKLDSIQSSQYVLYDEMTKANSALGQVNGYMRKLQQSVETIEQSSVINMQCADITRKNVEALKYINLIK